MTPIADTFLTMVNLRSLDIRGNQSAADIEGIARTPFVPQLTRLLLSLDMALDSSYLAAWTDTEKIESNAQVSVLNLLLNPAVNLVELHLDQVPSAVVFEEAPLEHLESLMLGYCGYLKVIWPLVARPRPNLRSIEFRSAAYFPPSEWELPFTAQDKLPKITSCMILREQLDDWSFLKNINLPTLEILLFHYCNLPPTDDTPGYLSEAAERGSLDNIKVLELGSRLQYCKPDPTAVLAIINERRQRHSY